MLNPLNINNPAKTFSSNFQNRIKTQLIFRKLLLPYFLFSISCFPATPTHSQAGEWTWIKGDSITNAAGSFGTIGVASLSNKPPAAYEADQWTDKEGNFWLYGGSGFGEYSAMWKYNVSSNMWTWMQGSSASGLAAVYGTQGIPAPANSPGRRIFGSATWVDTTGNLWLFGGYGSDSNNDLWMYDVTTNEWTWMKGPTFPFSPGIYGTQGVPDINNNPPSKLECACSWTDSENNLWLYGGQDLLTIGLSGYNDLWKYNISTNEWTWINGSNISNVPAEYGTMGIPDPLNTPGARWVYAKWVDDQDNLWLFGGIHANSIGNFEVLNDLWKYDINSSQWTWVSGPSVINDAGTYGPKCSFSSAYIPPSRYETKSCWRDANGRFFLFGGLDPVTFITYGDLWVYNPASNEWGWIGGDSSLQNLPVYGALGVSSPLSKPGGRMGAISWTDLQNNLWMFGGYDIMGGVRNDLWRFIPDVDCYPALQVNFIASATHLCEKFCVDFSDQSINNPTSWQWNFPGGVPSSSSDQNPTNICYNTPGTYDVTLITTNASGGDTLTLSNYITVYATPAIPVITQAGYILTSSNATSYQWQLNNADIPGATNQSFDVQQSGFYTVIIYDQNGCSSSASQYVLIEGVEALGGDVSVLIYPNPSDGKFIVELSNFHPNDNLKIEIYNTLGQIVYSSEEFSLISANMNYKKEIEMQNKPAGIYLIALKTRQGIINHNVIISQ